MAVYIPRFVYVDKLVIYARALADDRTEDAVKFVGSHELSIESSSESGSGIRRSRCRTSLKLSYFRIQCSKLKDERRPGPAHQNSLPRQGVLRLNPLAGPVENGGRQGNHIALIALEYVST